MAIPPYMTQPFSESHFLLIPSISRHFCESSALLVGKSFKRQLQNNSLLCEYLTLYQAVLHLLIKARKAPTSNQRLMLISTFFTFTWLQSSGHLVFHRFFLLHRFPINLPKTSQLFFFQYHIFQQSEQQYHQVISKYAPAPSYQTVSNRHFVKYGAVARTI